MNVRRQEKAKVMRSIQREAGQVCIGYIGLGMLVLFSLLSLRNGEDIVEEVGFGSLWCVVLIVRVLRLRHFKKKLSVLDAAPPRYQKKAHAR